MLGGGQLGQHHHSIAALHPSVVPAKVNQEYFQLKLDVTLAPSTKMSVLISDNSRFSNCGRPQFAPGGGCGIPQPAGISNRNSLRLESNVNHRKQSPRPRSNRRYLEFRACEIHTETEQRSVERVLRAAHTALRNSPDLPLISNRRSVIRIRRNSHKTLTGASV
jgi:hypothetical protein